MTYLFWPNPPTAAYSSTKVVLLLVICFGMVVASFIIKHWRRNLSNAVTKKLSRSWSLVLMWLGLVGLFLVVCRVEGISFVSMRAWWGVWLLVALIYAGIQMKMFRARHYELVPQKQEPDDPREKYLPKQKRRK